jgi:hypothetical protein
LDKLQILASILVSDKSSGNQPESIMKTNFAFNHFLALALAVVVLPGIPSQAAESSATITTTATSSSNTLPDNIQPGTPAAQVIKLVQAGVDASVIQTYVTDCPTAFKLDADKIISLTDAGVPSDLVNAMIAHDKQFLASLPMAEPPDTAGTAPAPETNAPVADISSTTSAPPDEVTVNYFYNTLTPYGSWVTVDGYGLCWRPTVVVYNSSWRPYCDRGHWVYTDCGWYWDSDYAWGITFHYGRWFNSPRYGWCWWPDTVWGPSWVTWRSSTEYCGWAPLPPFSVYHPGIGFSYHGKNVAVNFGFGLPTSCFTFVSASHFCAPNPGYYCVPQHEVTHIYGQTAVCNDYRWHNHNICNNGVSVTIIGSAVHHPVRAVPIGSLVNASRHGWHGETRWHQERPFGASNVNPGRPSHFADTDHHRDNVPHGEYGNRAPAENHGNFHAQPPAMNPRDNRNDRLPNDSAHRFADRSYRSSSAVIHPAAPAINTTPPAPTKPVIVPTRIVQYSPARSEPRPPTRQFNPQRTYSAPTITVGQPQRSDPRQNMVQFSPRQQAPVISSPRAPVRYQNPALNGNNNGTRGWVAHNP